VSFEHSIICVERIRFMRVEMIPDSAVISGTILGLLQSKIIFE